MELYVNEDPGGLNLEQALERVSPARREYALRYRNELDRKLSVAVYLLLKEALRKKYGIDENPELAVGVNGKPYLPDHPEIHFNFSHCPTAAVCAVSPHPIGVDVETITPVDWVVAERVLSRDELIEVKSAGHPDLTFLRYWTRKEALVKLRGEALDERRLPLLLNDVRTECFETRLTANYVLSTAFEPV